MRRLGSTRGAGGRAAAARGVTLFEVLIAILVFSLGLLGLGGMLVVSVKTNRAAYLLSQASFVAESMADRMRGNAAGVWQGDYARHYPTSDSDPCAAGAACPRDAVATRDRFFFSRQLAQALPQATADIACSNAAVAIAAADATAAAPYAGLCTIRVRWNGQTLERGTQANAAPAHDAVVDSYAWAFQP